MNKQATIKLSCDEFVSIFLSFNQRAVVTRNPKVEHESNFCPPRNAGGLWRNGYWPNPLNVKAHEALAIHFVERDSKVYLGDFVGISPVENGRCSYLMENVVIYELTDWAQHCQLGTVIRSILKPDGAVLHSYFPSLKDGMSKYELDESPTNEQREVTRQLRKIRPEQHLFRMRVFARHGKKCIVTGCTIPSLLEAAHIRGRSWETGDNSGDDGIPLRVDVHRAYDCKLIDVDLANGDHDLQSLKSKAFGSFDYGQG